MYTLYRGYHVEEAKATLTTDNSWTLESTDTHAS